MNAALAQLLRSTKQRMTQIEGDLARFTGRNRQLTRDELYHQGYQSGRMAELESLASVLEMALASEEAFRK